MTEKDPRHLDHAAHQGRENLGHDYRTPTSSTQVYNAPVVTTPIHENVHDPDKCKGLANAYILGVALGLMGAHHFYLRRPGWGCLYLFTLGLFGVGYLVDLIRMPWLVRSVRLEEKMRGHPSWVQQRSIGETYLLWMPLGLFGAHHFYLKNIGWGFAYLFTFGLCGMGWLLDICCIPSMVKEQNINEMAKHAIRRGAPVVVAPPGDNLNPHDVISSKSLITTYRLCLFPFTGLLGAHHYYMGRTAYGLIYTFTLGGFGFSWFTDWFRLPIILKDANKRRREQKGFRERRLDDCYFIAIPMGLFGAHHFYLRRVGWGFLYFFTVGCFGIGWLIDLIRMPCLVRKHKEDMKRRLLENQGSESGGQVSGNAGVLTYGGPGVPSQHVQTLGPGVYVVSPGHVVPVYPGDSTSGGPVFQVLPSNAAGASQSGIPRGAIPSSGNPPGYVTEGGVAPAYAPKANGETGLPPYDLPPPGYDEAGMSSFSTIDSSNVDGPPSYQNAILEGPVNQAHMTTTGHSLPTAPSDDL